MKAAIHPVLYEVDAHCACGHEFKTLSTVSQLRVTICSHCHPFCTGEEKFVDTAGRIEKFNKKYQRS